MKAGDLVEFRGGLFGIQPPNNLGIILELNTRKKTKYVKLLTLKGTHEIKAAQLTKRRFKHHIDLKKIKEKQLRQELTPRLKEWIKVVSSAPDSALQVSPDARSDKPVERELWEKICKNPVEMTTKELAEAWFDKPPVIDQTKLIAEVLEEDNGGGYFKLISTTPDVWLPLTIEQHQAIKQEIQRLETLRRRLVEIDEIEDEDGFLQKVYLPIELDFALVTEEDKQTLARVQQWMAEIVLTKSDPKEDVLGGTHVHTIDNFSLFRYLRFLAEDWTETRYLLQSASAMTEFLIRTGYLSETEILEILTKRVVAENPNFDWEINPLIEQLANELSDPADHPEGYANRKDLRHLLAYTIDPATARDFDQALSFQKNEDGTYILWVHIADVTHYVQPDSPLDKWARKRATSCYLPHRVLPMYPPGLSTNICALKAEVPRLCFTLELLFSATGERLKADIYEAVIQVKGNLSYDYVDEQLEKEDPYFTGMDEFSKLLRTHRKGLDIETLETRLSTDTPALELSVEEVSRSSVMNEVFMVVANEAIAERLRDSGFSGFYRCHPLPDRDRIEKFNSQMVSLGVECKVEPPLIETLVEVTTKGKKTGVPDEPDGEASVLDVLKSGGKMSFDQMLRGAMGVDDEEETEEEDETSVEVTITGLAQLSPEDREKWLQPFREVLSQVNEVDDPDQRLIMHLTTLGMMGRAFYTRQNFGHFGLGSPCYTHFTAPIRRYSDNVVHRLLKHILNNLEAKEPLYSDEELDELSEHCSEQARSAEDIEFQVKGIGMAMLTRRPEWSGQMSGLVTRILPYAVFVLLRRVVDGRVRLTDLTSDEVIVDPAESIAFRKRDENVILKQIKTSDDWQQMLDEEDEPIEILTRLGDKISVKIVARDYVDGKVSVKPV
ncbi:MAG: RNB domain-containing ribonuclease [Candidatus Hermodarchaeota archaeon]